MDESQEPDDLDQDDWDERTYEGSVTGQKMQPPGAATEAYLIVLAGSHVGEMIKVNRDIVVGRGRAAGFRVKDPSVSKEHVKLAVDRRGEIVAEDLGSRNGTFVNGEAIGRRVLRDGDKIYIGTTTILKFSLADSLEESFQQNMYQAAIRDPLTGLYNRRYLAEQLDSEVGYARRHGVPLAVVMLDLDHFKQVNDRFGHPAGDTVLVGVAKRLSEIIRKEDVVARFGGEEFTVVCRATPLDHAAMVAERIRQAVQARRFLPDHPDYVVTVSAGVAGMPDLKITDTRSLLQAADRGLYLAKRDGRNRVCRYEPSRDADDDATSPGDPKKT